MNSHLSSASKMLRSTDSRNHKGGAGERSYRVSSPDGCPRLTTLLAGVGLLAGMAFVFSLAAVAQSAPPAPGIIGTWAGNGTEGYSGDGGAATSAEVDEPVGARFDAAGNLYIADINNARIRKIAAGTGQITTVAGDGANMFTGDGVQATSTALNGPNDVAVDAAGNIYIADSWNNRIRKVTMATGIITTVAGNGNEGYSGDGGLATSAELDGPSAVALDASGNIYIADMYNGRIRMVAAATGVITTVAGGGYGAGTGDGGPATSAGLGYVTAVFVDTTGNLYIADYLASNIRKVTPSGIISTVAGNGTPGYSGDGGPATSAELSYPEGLTVDTSGNIYISDTGNYVVRMVNASTGTISTIAGNGTANDSGDGGSATSAALRSPCGLALDAAGNLYITDADSQRVRVVGKPIIFNTGTPVPVITTVAGDGIAGYAGDYDQATRAELNSPSDMALDASGNLFFADTLNHRIRKMYGFSGIIRTVAGNGTAGYAGDSGPAGSAELYYPGNAIVDAVGNIYIADTENSVIRKVAATTGIITTIAGNGNTGYSGDGGPATTAELSYPGVVALDTAGNLYIADSGNNAIRRVAISTGIITTVAGTGTAGYAGDGGAATSAELNSPMEVAVDAAGNLFIADTFSDRIREVTAATGVITTVAGNGTEGYTGDGGPATSAGLIEPYGIGVDSSGNFYIADTGNSAIRKVSTSTGIITTVAGNGTAGFAGDGGPATAAELNYPIDVKVDTDGNLYIADTSNNRIRKVSPMKLKPDITWPTPAPIAYGTALSGTQLNAASRIPGTFTYTPAAGTVLALGPHTLTATFTPNDSADYVTTTATTYITVANGFSYVDAGTITLTVGGVVSATTNYGSGSTPATIAAGLAAGVTAGSYVNVTAVNGALYLEAKQGGAGTNYSYSLATTSYDSQDFSQPSFVYPTVSGNLEGGANQNAVGSIVYKYTVPSGGYDPVGNLQSYTDSVMGTWSFNYDNLNQLVSSTSGADAPAPYAGNYGCWSYDAFGNRRSESISTTPCANGPAPTSWAHYNTHNQFLETSQAPGGIRYDGAGNITNDGVNQYLYDGDGRICAVMSQPLPSMTTMTGYIYDADGTRVSKGTISSWSCDPVINGFQTTSDYVLGLSGEQVTEMGAGQNGTMTWQHTNVYAAGGLLATYDQDGLHFYLNDPLGTRRAQTDYAGVPEQTCSSLPFGNGLACTGSNQYPTEHHFTGKERDTESGLDYFGARYNASTMGRWMSPDWSAKAEPVPYSKLDNPQSLNLYSYVWNNPLSRRDPDGHYTCADSAKCDSANDKAFQSRLDNLKAAQGTFKEGSSEYKQIGKILSSYGGAGDTKTADGKTVSIGFSGGANTGGVTQAIDKGTIGVTLANNFSAQASGNNVGSTVLVGHEGQHVVDGAPSGTARFGSEMRAESVSQTILNGLAGTPVMPSNMDSFSIRGITTWQRDAPYTYDPGAAFRIAVEDYRQDVQNDPK